MYITRPVRDPAGPRLPRGAPGPSVADRVVINLRQVLPVWMQIRLKFRSLTTDAPVLRPARSYRAANNLSPPLPPPLPGQRARRAAISIWGRGEGGGRPASARESAEDAADEREVRSESRLRCGLRGV